MSRLYNTLEKIRLATQGAESSSSQPLPGPAPAAKRPLPRLWLGLLGCAVVIAGAALGLYLSQGKNHQRQTMTTVKPPAVPAQPAAPPATAAVTVPAPPPQDVEARYLQLNETGVALLRQDKQWASIHAFDQARQLVPNRPEALINMAVALAELGLRVPAQRLLRQARTLGTDHPMLQRNLELLRQSGFLEDPNELSLPSPAPAASQGAKGNH